MRSAQPDGTALDMLEVRVDEAGAINRVNGQAVATVPLRAGHLAGAPGVQVEAGGDGIVSALTVAGPQVVGRAAAAQVGQ